MLLIGRIGHLALKQQRCLLVRDCFPQDEVNREDLMEALYLEFVNRVNEVGVDVNKCVAYTHTAPLVQFVCGLGPRKGYHLLRVGVSLTALCSTTCVVVYLSLSC